MLPASNRGAGQSLAFPDVCNTPAGPVTVPVPYPCVAMNAQAAGFSATVKVSMVNALNLASTIPMTNGDQAGVAHPSVMGQATFTAGNPTVFIDKLPAVGLLAPSTGNNMNAPVGAVLVPSAVNVFYSLARPPTAPGDAGWVEELCHRRAELDRAEVSAELRDGGVLWLEIGSFAADVVRRVAVATRGLPAPTSVVVDLRGNPGGDLSGALDLAADFVPRGSVLARLVDGDGDIEEVLAARAPRYGCPVIALVDERTASAAESFVRALRGAAQLTVVGRRTYGKDYATALTLDAGGAAGLHPALGCTAPGEGGPIEPDVILEGSSASWPVGHAIAWYAGGSAPSGASPRDQPDDPRTNASRRLPA